MMFYDALKLKLRNKVKSIRTEPIYFDTLP